MQVVVLLSSYQGERFIAQQLESILTQLPLDGRILVRDDGSRDSTADRVEAFGDPRISVTRGENVGFVRSFLTLLEAVPPEADIIMLCDQDDIWLPDKIERAVNHLRNLTGQPALYCSRLQLVDENLKPIGLSPAWPRPPSFRNALTENIVTGCTCAINRAALPLARRYGNPELIYFHDWWLYLVIAAFGKVVVDPQPTILYRQHGGNAIGMGAGVARYLAIVRFMNKKSWVHIMYNQIENFRALYVDQLSQDDRRLFDRYFNPHRPSTVTRLLLVPMRCRQTLLSDILFRMILVFEFVTGRGLLPECVRNPPGARHPTLK